MFLKEKDCLFFYSHVFPAICVLIQARKAASILLKFAKVLLKFVNLSANILTSMSLCSNINGLTGCKTLGTSHVRGKRLFVSPRKWLCGNITFVPNWHMD